MLEEDTALQTVLKVLIFIGLFIALLGIASKVQAQDVHINCANVNPCTLTPSGGLPWSQANQVWIFTPSYPNTNIYVHLHNRNGTSAHTQTVTMSQTPFGRPTAPSLSQNSDFWEPVTLTQSTTASASCNSLAANSTATPGSASGTGTCYGVGMQAAQIAIRITGASSQAGSPDNVDISITQSLASYPGGPNPGQDSSAGGNLLTGTTPADATSNSSIPGIQSFGSIFDGTNWDRSRSFARSNIVGQGSSQPGVELTTGYPAWSISTQGTAANCSTSAAAVIGIAHCATAVSFCIGATAAQGNLFANLRNGTTGTGTILWSGIVAGVIGTSDCITQTFSDPICGTGNTAMTAELSAATASTVTCAVTLNAIDAQ